MCFGQRWIGGDGAARGIERLGPLVERKREALVGPDAVRAAELRPGRRMVRLQGHGRFEIAAAL